MNPFLLSGMNYFTPSRMEKYLQELQNIDSSGGGYDFLIHAIGDRGVREALDAIEETLGEQDQPARHRLTHVELVTQTDTQRFKELSVIADAQARNRPEKL